MQTIQLEPRGRRFKIAVVLALLAHVVALVGFFKLESLPALFAVAYPAAKEPPPVKVVFFPPPKTPEPPPENADLYSSESHRASRPGGEPAAPAAPPVAPAPPAPRPQPRRRAQDQAAARAAAQAEAAAQEAARAALQPLPLAASATGTEPAATPAPSGPPGPAGAAQAEGFSPGAIGQAIARQDWAGAGPHGGAGEGAGPPGGVLDFDAKDFEWGPYSRQVYFIIKKNWEAVLRSQNIVEGVRGRSRLRFRIARSGHVDALELLAGSSWDMLDRAAMASVELSNPLPPLPPAYPHSDVGVTFSYFYNVAIDPADPNL